MYDYGLKRSSKSLSHAVRLYARLKSFDKCVVCSMNIIYYAKLFKKATGENLFYKELKRDTYRVSLKPLKN